MDEGSLFQRPPVMLGGLIFEREETEPFHFQLHKHDYVTEMFYVKRGEGRFTIDGVTYQASAGTLLFYQQGIWHEERSTAHPFESMYVGFKGMQLRGLPANFFVPPDREPMWKLGEHAADFEADLERCIEEFSRGEPESRTIGSHLLGVVLARLAKLVHYREPVSPPKPSQTVVLRTRQYIEENYHQPITLELLSRMTFVNEYYLAHLFKEEMGISPIQYLIHCRMEAAKRYLLMNDYAVGQIAGLVGYESETTFHRMFKKTAGVTPAQYRKQGEEQD